MSRPQHPHQRHLSRLSIHHQPHPGMPSAGHPETPLFTPAMYTPFAFQQQQQQFQHHQQQQQQQGPPFFGGHRQRPSLAGVPGFIPGMQQGPPMTPQFPHFAGVVPPTPGAGPSGQPGQPHHGKRRNLSISIGGPPKALLGGPQRKVSPLPTPVGEDTPKPKAKKMVVKLPQESFLDDLAPQPGSKKSPSSRQRAPWARDPLPVEELLAQPYHTMPDASSVAVYPESIDGLPTTFQVSLPRQATWTTLKQNVMEEKLAKLGVERGSGFTPGHGIRSASVSGSPADPALLLFHLNKLQHTPGASPLSMATSLSPGQQQPLNPLTPGSTGNSLAPPISIGPKSSVLSPTGLHSQSPSLSPLPPRFNQMFGRGSSPNKLGGHGHSMSLASPSSYTNSINPYFPVGGLNTGSTNPFGQNATLGGEGILGSRGSGTPNSGRSPQPPLSLASVSEAPSEADEDAEDASQSVSQSSGLLHAPRGIVPVRPVFVSSNTSPNPASVTLTDNDDATKVNSDAPVPHVSAKSLGQEDFMRGFGMLSEEEENVDGTEEEEIDEEGEPIMDEGQRVSEIMEQTLEPATPTQAIGPATAATPKTYRDQTGDQDEDDLAENDDPAEDADEEDADASFSDLDEEEIQGVDTDPDEDNFTTPNHSRHVSRISVAPSLVELGGSAGCVGNMGGRGALELAGSQGVKEEDLEDDSVNHYSGDLNLQNVNGVDQFEEGNESDVVEGTQEWTASEDMEKDHVVQEIVTDSESIGEWSNPSDEERARQEKMERRLRRAQEATPRKLPRFPAPPSSAPDLSTYNHKHPHYSSMHASDTDYHVGSGYAPARSATNSEDIVSNPSDDERLGHGVDGHTFFGTPHLPGHGDHHFGTPGSQGIVQRPLPPLPHSRQSSLTNHLAYGSPHTQHGSPSASTATPLMMAHRHMASTGSATSSAMNPLAKPFVFGLKPGSGSFQLQSPVTDLASPSLNGPSLHARQSSIGNRLNATAAEFKPGAFSFKPPTNVPTMQFPAPSPSRHVQSQSSLEMSRPLPQLPHQGREKRQRRGSLGSSFDHKNELGEEDVAQFDFPRPWTPSREAAGREDVQMPQPESDVEVVEESVSEPPQSSMDRRDSVLNINAKPFTFNGKFVSTFGASLNVAAPVFTPSFASSFAVPSQPMQQSVSEQHSPVHASELDVDGVMGSKAFSMPASTSGSPPISMPEPISYQLPQVDDLNLNSSTMFNKSNAAGKRPPIPDFNKHPTSTAPAALFKALSQSPDHHKSPAEPPSRPFARPMLSSREYLFEHHKRPSLDDNNIAPISMSMKLSNRMTPVTPIAMPTPIHHPIGPPAIALAPPPVKGRRSSFPAPPSLEEVPAPVVSAPKFPSPVPELSVAPLPPTSSAENGDENSRLEKIVQEKMARIHNDLMSLGQNKIADVDTVTKAAIAQLVTSFRAQMIEISRKAHETEVTGKADAHGEVDFEMIRNSIEQGKTEVQAILQQQLHEIADKMQKEVAHRPPPPSMEVLHSIEDLREMMISSVNGAITTLMAHMDTVDGLAQRRPVDERQILIRELSAYLAPQLQSLRQDPMDIQQLTIQLAEAVKPSLFQIIDLASDKKETAELILQHLVPALQSLKPPRLDMDEIAHKLAEDIIRLAPPTDPHVIKEEVSDLVVERLDARLRNRDNLFSPDLIVKKIVEIVQPLSDLSNIPTPAALESVQSRQEELCAQGNALVQQQKELSDKLSVVPSTLAEALELLKVAQAEMVEKNKALSEVQELQRISAANAELQVQLGKARSSHGQVRSEKDLIAQKLHATETERDRLRADLAAFKERAEAKDVELTASNAKATTLERELEATMTKLKESEAAAESQQIKLTESNAIHQEHQITIDEQSAKIKGFEADIAASSKVMESESQVRQRLEVEINTLRAEQQQWDELRRTREQVELIARLIGEADSEEVKELRRIRDRSVELQSEHASLQKICSDQEAQITSMQKAANIAKQTMGESKQKISQWERRASELEAELETTQTQLEQTTDAHRQVSVDVENLQAELDEKESQVKDAEEREQALRNQVVTLESQLLSMKTELEEALARAEKQFIHAPRPQAVGNMFNSVAVANGRPGPRSCTPPSRPGTATPNNAQSSLSQTSTPPEPDTPLNKGIWDSIHAPKSHASTHYQSGYSSSPTPGRPSPSTTFAKSMYGYRGTALPMAGSPFGRADAASPSPSTVSVAATEGPDGWWH